MLSHSTFLLALSAGASAHMRLGWPKPFDYANLDQAPLTAADFPCKARISGGGYKIDTMNEWNAGETKEISFIGDAVHGGGSCQFSLTTDQKPTKDSQWKVFTSVIGGCPSSAPGNLGGDPNGLNADKFQVTLPKDIAPGQYTFAWTWINKVGQREFYMNCAPIKVGGGSSGGSSKRDAASALAALPDMYVANLPNTECSTSEGEDFQYPNPGEVVIKGPKASPGNTMKVNTGCAAQNKLGAGNGQMGSPAAPAPGGASGSPAPSGGSGYSAAPAPGSTGTPSSGSPGTPGSGYPAAPSSGSGYPAAPGSGSPSAPGSGYPAAPSSGSGYPAAPGSGSPSSGSGTPGSSPSAAPGSGTPASGYPAAPAKSSSAASGSSPSAAPGSGYPSSGSPGSSVPPKGQPANGSTDTPQCPEGAYFICNKQNPKQFALCDTNAPVFWQEMAGGTECTENGISAAASKRSVHFRRAHMHRRHGHSL